MFIRIERATVRKYGTHVWIGKRVRIGSRRTMTPMRPHVRKGDDENCNDVLAFHLYPLVAIDIWWRRKQRTWRDGMCDSCVQDLRDAGLSDLAISGLNELQMEQGAREEERRERMSDPVHQPSFQEEVAGATRRRRMKSLSDLIPMTVPRETAIELARKARDARDQAFRDAAFRIRAEWVCGCVEESDDPSAWHTSCRYTEWAARNVESLIGTESGDQPENTTPVTNTRQF